MDPRIARSRDAVVDATKDLLEEVGFAGLTIDGIAKRSGVARTTIYRQWPSLPELLSDVGAMVGCYVAPDQTDDPIADIRAILRALRDALDDEWGRILPCLVDAAARDDEIRGLMAARVRERRAPTTAALNRLAKRGDLPSGSDLEALTDRLGAPIFYRRLITQQPVDDRYIDELVDAVLASSRFSPASGVT